VFGCRRLDVTHDGSARDQVGEATDAAMETAAAIDRFLELHRERGEPSPSTAHEERLHEAARGAGLSAELAAMNIRRFLDLQERELGSLIMRAAVERGEA